MSDEVRAVEFVAEVRQVKTMADGTVNLTLNLPEYCKPQAAWFMQHQGEQVKSVSELDSLINNTDQQNAISEGNKRKRQWASAKDKSDSRES
jgi:hypothetical protein